MIVIDELRVRLWLCLICSTGIIHDDRQNIFIVQATCYCLTSFHQSVYNDPFKSYILRLKKQRLSQFFSTEF
jgi:hypothetical protein